MYQIQLFSVLALDLIENPGHALENCLVVAVNTNTPADPAAYLHAIITGGKQDANASFVLRVKSIEKKPAASHCTPKTREEHEKVRAILAAGGLGDWPVVMLVFTSEGLSILQIPYVIDPQAMQEALERRPSVV
ncbi:hypothetical protein DFH06DRAFT_1127096 [Mycena polygramma]|nr:hypothetical protein DFH06DRAFT_1127096 [Mycena polygramma]